jgi:hypothetical protein
MKYEEARRLALSLPEAVEADHHGFPSFRVRGKIFATAPDDTFFNVMVDEEEALAVAGEHPGVCEVVHWGKRIAGVRVELRRVKPSLLTLLLTDAWRKKAPRSLASAR